jgi:hypothetical protein
MINNNMDINNDGSDISLSEDTNLHSPAGYKTKTMESLG